ncbi:MAG: hypothetical protein EOO88_53630 [Pedobacter sp.]|nr:MAG: hypothetical protein EOO88_53630 [Pedobacter sp.]
MGLYFCFVRPPLLPEDILYIGSLSQNEKTAMPGLTKWLQKVFWAMGGYIFTVGLLTVFISVTTFRHRLRGVFSIMCLAGITSIGLMTTVNFIIASEFRWLLFSFTGLWAFALLLYRLHK